MPVIPLLPCFDRFLVISIFERKKGGGCRRGNLFNLNRFIPEMDSKLLFIYIYTSEN